MCTKSIVFILDDAFLKDRFPCADDTWTYSSLSGKCYTLLVDERHFKPNEAEQMCKDLLSHFRDTNVNVAEIRSKNEMAALKEFLVQHSLKERVLLNAIRYGECILSISANLNSASIQTRS